MRKTMKQFPKELQPRERGYEHGTVSLTNTELLAIILRTGSKDLSALELAHKILLGEGSLGDILELGVEELRKYEGVGKVKAISILASLEMGKRMSKEKKPDRPIIHSPGDAAFIVMEEMKRLKKENFRMMALNTKNHVVAVETISVGNLNSSIVHPRELFRQAIRHAAAGIILVHNHPSGDTTPSQEDLLITERIVEAGQIMGIEVLDHIIVAGDGYLSFKEEDLI
jgi:DNA repair protein RadC